MAGASIYRCRLCELWGSYMAALRRRKYLDKTCNCNLLFDTGIVISVDFEKQSEKTDRGGDKRKYMENGGVMIW